MATGYKDYNGHGKQVRTSGGQNGTQASEVNLNAQKKNQISDNATKVGKSYGINVGRIPGKTKISGKLKNKCSNNHSSITLGQDTGNVGRENGKTNKNLFGEVKFNCNNQSGTLYLKGEGDNTSRKNGGYGRVKMKS